MRCSRQWRGQQSRSRWRSNQAASAGCERQSEGPSATRPTVCNRAPHGTLYVFGQVYPCPRSLHPDRDELDIVYEESALSSHAIVREYCSLSTELAQVIPDLPEKGHAPKYVSEGQNVHGGDASMPGQVLMLWNYKLARCVHY